MEQFPGLGRSIMPAPMIAPANVKPTGVATKLRGAEKRTKGCGEEN